MTNRDITVLVSTESAALYLGVTGRQVRRMARAGKLPHRTVDGALRFSVGFLRVWRSA